MKIRLTDSQGRIYLGKEFANKTITIEETEKGVFYIQLAEGIKPKKSLKTKAPKKNE